jgi:hypothetical protein
MSLQTSNVFAALSAESARAAKKSSSSKSSSSKADKAAKKKKNPSTADLERAIFSQPSANISSWADEEDDEFSVQLPPTWADEVGVFLVFALCWENCHTKKTRGDHDSS